MWIDAEQASRGGEERSMKNYYVIDGFGKKAFVGSRLECEEFCE